MKQGFAGLTAMAQELDRRRNAKVDYKVPTTRLEFAPAPEPARIDLLVHTPEGTDQLAVNQVAHRQIGTHLAIPAKYYDRMQNDAPDLLAQNVNHWFMQSPERRMVRALDGTARAFLSELYNPIDDDDIMGAILPIFTRLPHDIEFQSSAITDRNFYLKVAFPWVEAEVPVTRQGRTVGEALRAGVMVRNSETGFGKWQVVPFVTVLACLNGMVVDKMGIGGVHLGGRREELETVRKLYKDDTVRAEVTAIQLKVRDVVGALTDRQAFEPIVAEIRGATTRRITGHVEQAVEVLRKQQGLTESEGGDILRHLIDGGDLSQWGLSNAITRTAHDVESYDRATELETLGHRVITLPDTEWTHIAQAA